MRLPNAELEVDGCESFALCRRGGCKKEGAEEGGVRSGGVNDVTADVEAWRAAAAHDSTFPDLDFWKFTKNQTPLSIRYQ